MPDQPLHPDDPQNTSGNANIPLSRHIAIQFGAFFLILSVAWPYYLITRQTLPWPMVCIAIGVVALGTSHYCSQPWWWQVIHACFAPLLFGAHSLAVDPKWYLLALILSSLVFRGAVSGQIPLFLSNRQTVQKLLDITQNEPNLVLLDIGAGTGTVIRQLASARPDARFSGVENAPLTWLIGRLRTIGLANCGWRFGSLWDISWADYNVIYAFLSPAPMAELWAKATREMPDGSLLISNTFAIPGVEPSREVRVGDRRDTCLYCYRIRRS